MSDFGDRYSVGVVGGGLIGSAASRHLAEAGHRVVVIAAPEPNGWSLHDGPFASHYDSGRITRISSRDPVWAELAARSTGRYADIEQRSGITFHDPRGLAWFGVDLASTVTNAVDRGGEARIVSEDWMYETTGIRRPSLPDMECAWEGPPAGVVNPRQLAAAQLALAESAGAVVLRQPATKLTSVADGVAVSGAFGEVVADRVLVAAGAYSAQLIGENLEHDRQLRTTVRVDLGSAPEMPSIISEQVEHPYINDMYSNPPVRYPDGRLLFKIGCEILDPPRAQSIEEITAWFQGNGDPEEADALVATTRALLPDADIRSWEAVPCVITRSTSRYPNIGWIDDRIAIAAAGNGSSAKSSDELGRLASTLFSEHGWHDEVLSAKTFALV